MQLQERIQDKLLGSLTTCNAPDWAPMVAGGLLAGFGLARRSLPGLLMAGLGGAMVYRSMGRLSPGQLEPTCQTAVQRDGSQPPIGDDVVDEASWESFPASDAPGY